MSKAGEKAPTTDEAEATELRRLVLELAHERRELQLQLEQRKDASWGGRSASSNADASWGGRRRESPARSLHVDTDQMRLSNSARAAEEAALESERTLIAAQRSIADQQATIDAQNRKIAQLTSELQASQLALQEAHAAHRSLEADLRHLRVVEIDLGVAKMENKRLSMLLRREVSPNRTYKSGPRHADPQDSSPAAPRASQPAPRDSRSPEETTMPKRSTGRITAFPDVEVFVKRPQRNHADDPTRERPLRRDAPPSLKAHESIHAPNAPAAVDTATTRSAHRTDEHRRSDRPTQPLDDDLEAALTASPNTTHVVLPPRAGHTLRAPKVITYDASNAW